MREPDPSAARALILSREDLTPEQVEALLLPWGFVDVARVDREMQALAEVYPSREACAEALPFILRAASRSPDPDLAFSRFVAYAQARVDAHAFFTSLKYIPPLLEDLMHVFGSSDYLSQVLIRNPHYLSWLLEMDSPATHKTREQMEEELRRWCRTLRSREGRLGILRRYKRRETFRIGMRDLIGVSSVQQTTRELAYLADVTFQIAYELGREELDAKYGIPHDSDGTPSRYAIIGMGKLGGEELNFSSDVDILAVYSDEGQTDKGTENATYFQRLTEYLVRAMSEPMSEGYVFRVDLRLRPGSQTGPLSRSLDSYEGFYESWGTLTDRQALIKARFVAGDASLGEEFLKRIQPFVYQTTLDREEIEDIIREIRQTKATIEARIGGDPNLHVKLGPGGIRDVEFTVQALQLVHGGSQPVLRVRGTIEAIERLAEVGLLAPERAKALTDSYCFMRRVENFLQLVADRQLYALPAEPEERERHARRLGYRSDGERTAGQQFTEDFERHRAVIRSEFDRVLSVPLDPTQATLSRILEEPEPSEESLRFLESFGLTDGREAYRILNRLAKGSDRVRFSPRVRRAFLKFSEPLLQAIAATPDPLLALSQLERFLSAAGARSQIYPLLQSHRNILELLVSILGTSRFLGDVLSRDPLSFEVLTYGSSLEMRLTSAEQVVSALKEQIAPTSREPLRDLQRFRYGELLRVGTRDILGKSSPVETTRELSLLAEGIVRYYAETLFERLCRERGRPRNADGTPATYAVIGMGKLGGSEINFSSDLDALFVFSDQGSTESGEENARFFGRFVMALVNDLKTPTLGGSIYDVDLRLRPYGRGGPMALSLEAYRNYYAREGMLWERQALIKARPVAGDESLGRRFMEVAHAFAYSRPLTRTEIEEIRHTRERKENKAASETSRVRNIKSGIGGLVDIEFLVQTLQLHYGPQDEYLRTTNTMDALTRLHERSLLSSVEVSWLTDMYLFLRFVEDRLHIVDNRPLSALPDDAEALEKLARRLGYVASDDATARERFLNEYYERTRATRELYEQVYERLLHAAEDDR